MRKSAPVAASTWAAFGSRQEEAFARQIATLYDPERWRSFSRAAIQRARTHLSVEVMGEGYLALMRDLVADVGRVIGARGQPDPWRTLFEWQDFLPPPLLRRLRGLRRRLRSL